MNRRSFLRRMAAWGAVLGSGLSLTGRARAEMSGGVAGPRSSPLRSHSGVQGSKSRVVLVRNEAVILQNGEVNGPVADEMVTGGMLRLTGESNIESAWKKLFRPSDVVGIKVNALGGRPIATHPGVVAAVVAGLKRAGVRQEDIIVWDRLTEELSKAGYTINSSGKGMRCFGTDKDYDPYPETAGSIGSCFSAIVSSRCTALINVPVLKDHDLSGVSLGLKNFYGAIHNPNKYHANNCDPYIADLNSHTYLKDKLRLVVCDGLALQYNGGPAFKPQWSVRYSTLMFGLDPVAIDRIGCKLIEEKRLEKGLPSLKDAGREPRHIASAAQKALGTNDLDSIDMVSI